MYGQVLQKQNTAFREEEDAHKPQKVKRSYMQEDKNMEDYWKPLQTVIGSGKKDMLGVTL